MPVRYYRLRGPLVPVPGDQANSSDVWVTSADVFAKRANPTPPPYDVVNEYICGELAKLIRLPVPPSFIGRRESERQLYFCSPSFNLSGENPVPADCALLASQEPHIVSGILMFDIWVANTDRHDENLSFRREGSRVRLDIFDHTHALFRDGDSLDFHVGKLGITKLRPHYNRHCLLDHIASDIHFEKWLNRIQAVSNEALQEILAEAVELDLPRTLADRGLEFLRVRRDTLRELVMANQHEFRSISQWSLEWNA
jgi:hypothetical protein